MLLLAFGTYRLLDNKGKQVFDSVTTHQDGFYNRMAEFNQDTIKQLDDADGVVKPNKLFAFGVGDELVDSSYGSFKAQ